MARVIDAPSLHHQEEAVGIAGKKIKRNSGHLRELRQIRDPVIRVRKVRQAELT